MSRGRGRSIRSPRGPASRSSAYRQVQRLPSSGARPLTAGRRRRRPLAAPVGVVLALAAFAAVLFAGVSLLGGDSASHGAVARSGVEHLTTPLPERPPAKPGFGSLPQPAGAARVDLSHPALLPYLHLYPPPKAGLAFNLANGRVLWRDGATRIEPIASLTKLMTGLLAVERFSPNSHVRVPRAATQVSVTHMGGLVPGRKVRAEVLLKGLMIASGNDAAVTLAIGGAGSEKAWVARMNARARLLGLSCTHYVDASGLDPRDHSCPADIAALAMRAMADPRLRDIARHAVARVWPGVGDKITLHTTNHLLRDHYPGAIGLKTGYTLLAGHCLVAIIQRGPTRIGIVLLGSKTDAFADARRVAREIARAGAIAPAT